jgi:hypothetical protein
MTKGFPASAFNDGDILISPHDTSEQWILWNGELTSVSNDNFQTRIPSPQETFYRMGTAMVDHLLKKLERLDAEGKIPVAEYDKLQKMVESGDEEARNLVDLHLDNLGK